MNTAIKTLDGKTITLSGETIDGLRSQLIGGLLQTTDPGYDEARKIWNAALSENPNHETLLAVMAKHQP